ncbi:MAG: GAF domain-containing protein [Myxococcota bacterium]|nr:GAF domain-containing protein [Myxococcota bacterium]
MAELELRVLVVDDERFFREAIRDTLAEAGIDCHALASGEAALEAARDPAVGVVVLDVGLGERGGIDLLRRLRAERPAVRVIVLSAHTDHELVLEALRLDASDYLAKPLHDEELVLAVRRALAGYDVESSWQRLRERLRRLEARLTKLAGPEPPTPGGADIEGFAKAVAEAVADLLDAGKTSVLLLDPETEDLRVVAATGCPLEAREMDPVEPGEGVAGVVLALGEALLVEDVTRDPRFADRVLRDRYESASLAAAPLRRDGRALGVLCATDTSGGAPLGEDDLALLRILALSVAGALAGAPAEVPEVEPAADESAAELDEAPEAPAVDAQSAAEELGEVPVDAQPAAGELGDLEPLAEVELATVEALPAPAVAEGDLARDVCEVLTLEIEPDRIFARVLQHAAEALGAPVASIHLIENESGELVLEREYERRGGGDRLRLERTRGLTGTALQTGILVAAPDPESDPRFDAEVDTPADGRVLPLLCVPLRMRGKVLGAFRAFPEDAPAVSARSGELLGSLLSAAVRNVLLYRSLLETIDELAEARREGSR